MRIKRPALFFMPLLFWLHSNAQTHCDSIQWSETPVLRWNHFKAHPDNTVPYGALSDVYIRYDYTVSGKLAQFHFSCCFSTCRSWIKPAARPELLAHEQEHFNLAEYYKRQLAEIILNEKFSGSTIDAKVDSIGKLINQRRLEMDVLYDQETKHSLDEEKQAIWSKKIRQMLRGITYDKSNYLVAIY
jgi:hypothetical protein